MSTAKKSIKWLVALVVVFALVLVASVALGQSVASASAENPTISVVAVATGADTNGDLNLVKSSSTQTIEVKYYISLPDVGGYTASSVVKLEAYVIPYLTNLVAKPTSIAANQRLDGKVELNVADYNAGTSAKIRISGEDVTLGDVLGAENWLFSATYTIPADAEAGVYSYGFNNAGGIGGGSFALDTTNAYQLVESGKKVYIREAIAVPALIETSFQFDGTTKTAYAVDSNETRYSVVAADSTLSAIEVPDNNGTYSVKFALANTNVTCWDLGNGNYSIENQTRTWTITPKPVTLAFADDYTSVYLDKTAAQILDTVAITGVNDIVNGYALTYSWEVSSGEYDSSAITVSNDPNGWTYLSGADVGVYTLGITYTQNKNYVVTATDTAVYSVTPATPTITIAKYTPAKVYDGNAVTDGTSNADITYSAAYMQDITSIVTPAALYYSDENCTDNINAPANAGTYYIKVSTLATRNYVSTFAVAEFKIGKATPTVTVTATGKEYDGTALSFGDDDTYDVYVTSSAGLEALALADADNLAAIAAMKNAGTYTNVTINFPGNANYNATTATIDSVTIDPREVGIASITVAPVTYKNANFSASDFAITAIEFDSDDIFGYLYANTLASDLSIFTFSTALDGTVKNVGTYNNVLGVSITGISSSFHDELIGNFTFDAGTASVTVVKNTPVLTITKVLEDGDVAKEYNGAAVSYAYNDSTKDLTYSADIIDDSTAVTAAFYANANGVKGASIDAPILPGTYWIVVSSTATANCNAAAPVERQFVIDPAEVNVKFSYQYGTEIVYLNYANGVFTAVEEADWTESTVLAGTAMPAAATYNYFYTAGFQNGQAIIDYSAETQSYVAVYTFNVGRGDIDGDGIVNVDDLINVRKLFEGHNSVANVPICTNDDAWGVKENDADYFFYTAIDVTKDEAYDARDVVAMLEAFATGYDYRIVTDKLLSGVTGQSIETTQPRLVYTYAELVEFVEKGYPVVFANDITNETADFNPIIGSPVDINLGGYQLTVNSFTLTSNLTKITLKVANGTLYTVDGITVTAPNGNVKVGSTTGYTYQSETPTVTLAAYSSSLHVESNVAFYMYKHEIVIPSEEPNEDPVTVTLSKADFKAAVADTENEITLTAVATVRKAETDQKMQEIAEIKADTTKTETQKAEAINDLTVKKSLVAVPVDTHVVVEESANLSVDKIIVQEASNAPATPEEQVKTFSIDVKSTSAEVVTVDVTKTDVNVNYVVENVEVAGTTGKVEIVKDEEQEISNIAGVKNEAELKAALASDAAVIKIGADFAVNGAITQNTSYCLAITRDVTIEGNGFVLTMGKANGVWIANASEVTIKDLTITTAMGNGRCINTRGGVGTLNLDNVTLTCTGSGNPQPITIGGDHRPYIGTALESVNVNVTRSNINAGASGYAIILFNKANISISDSTAAAGYAVIYEKAPNGSHGSRGSNIVIEDSVLSTGNYWSMAGANSFALFVDQDPYVSARPEGTTFTVTDTEINVKATGSAWQAVFTGTRNDTFVFDGCTFNLVGENAKMVYRTSYSRDSYILEDIDEENNVLSFTYTNCVANEEELNLALAYAIPYIKLVDDIDLTAPVNVGYELWLDMNGYKFYNTEDIWEGADWSLLSVGPGGDLTIFGDGQFLAKENDCYAIDVWGGANLVIEDGTYVGNCHAVYVYEGSLTVNGGDFSVLQVFSAAQPYDFVLNCYDASYLNGTATIEVNGGRFAGFNPGISNSEPNGPVNFVADGYVVIEEDGVYEVVEGAYVSTEAELRAAIAANESPIYIGADFDVAACVSVGANKNIVINMNGHTITSPDAFTFGVSGNGSLEFTGTGTIVYAGSKHTRGAVWVDGLADSTAVEATHLTIGEDVTIVSNGFGVMLYQVSGNYGYGAVLTVNGTIVAYESTITALGNISLHDGDVVNGEPIASISRINVGATADLTCTDNSTIYAAGFAVYNIEAGATVRGCTALYIKSGYINVEDGVELIATQAAYSGYTYSGSGEYPTGDAIVIDNCNYPGKNAVVNFGANLLDTVTVTAADAQKIATYWAVKTEAQFDDAVTAGAPKVVFIDDITTNRTVPVWGSAFDIDLNGHTYTANSEDGKTLSNMGYTAAAFCFASDEPNSVAIIENGSIVTAYGAGVYAAGENQTVILNNVTITAATVGVQTTPEYSSAVRITSKGTVIINSGSYTADPAGYVLAASNSGATFVVNGGSFDGKLFFSTATNSGVTKTITVNGGTFTNFAVVNANKGTLTITGGTFDADPSAYLAAGYTATEDNGVWTVSAVAASTVTPIEVAAVAANANEKIMALVDAKASTGHAEGDYAALGLDVDDVFVKVATANTEITSINLFGVTFSADETTTILACTTEISAPMLYVAYNEGTEEYDVYVPAAAFAALFADADALAIIGASGNNANAEVAYDDVEGSLDFRYYTIEQDWTAYLIVDVVEAEEGDYSVILIQEYDGEDPIGAPVFAIDKVVSGDSGYGVRSFPEYDGGDFRYTIALIDETGSDKGATSVLKVHVEEGLTGGGGSIEDNEEEI